MPKKLLNIKEKILAVSEELFMSGGYEKTDMRLIAEKAGIAVGTLYNYYPNKKDLFLKVFEKSWQEKLCSLDAIIAMDRTHESKLSTFLCEVYQYITENQGLSLEMLKLDTPATCGHIFAGKSKSFSFRLDSVSNQIKERLIILIDQGIQSGQLPLKPGMGDRLATTLILTAWDLSMEYVHEKEKNNAYLLDFVSLLYK